MIIRIVRMHFTEAGLGEFLGIFEENMRAIRGMPGCSHLELLRDIDDPLTFTTVSHWDDLKYLNAYRQSDLFGKVWGRVKTLFSQRSTAFSVEKYIEL
jgi:heme-degrading monooxygenase HmoA